MKRKLLLFLFASALLSSSLFAQVPGTSSAHNSGKNSSVLNGDTTLGNIYNNSACGLGYVQSSVKLGQRFIVSCCPSVNGPAQPASFTVTGIPPGAVILQAFFYTVVSGNGIPLTITITNPSSSTQNFPLTLIGQGMDKCWGYQSTNSYRGNVTSIISGNGNYIISGLPVDSSAVTHINDTDGGTLFIIYSDPADPQTGTLIMDDGLRVLISGNWGYSINGFTACANSLSAKSFLIVSDLQQIGTTFFVNGGSSFSVTPQEDWWNFIERPTSVFANQNTSRDSMIAVGDCIATIVAGLYYKTPCTNCCSSTFSLNVTNTPDSCNGTGTATATITGGVPPFTYLWNTSPPQTTATATGLTAGNYYFYCTDSSGCSFYNVNIPFTGVVVTTSSTDATCTVPGDASANASGGHGPYTYSWSTSPSQTTQTATGLISGTYSVIITDVNGCTGNAQVQVQNLNGPNLSISNTGTNCGNNASATIYAFGGTPPYTYSWSTSPAQTTQTATGLAAGIYSVYVTDNVSCQAMITTLVVNNPMDLHVYASQNSPGCANIFTLSATSNYPCTYSWSPIDTTLFCDTCAITYASILTTTTFTVTAYSACDTATQTITLQVGGNTITENLCLVTVDTSLNKNMLVWDKTATYPITAYNIYKETSPNVYTVIGTQSLSSYSTFVDLSSSPQVTDAKYAISTIDTCGKESNVSPHLKTMHLNVNAGNNAWDLSWTNYLGPSNPTFYIYRGTNNSNMTLIATTTANVFTYADFFPPPGNLQYVVTKSTASTCTPTLRLNENTLTGYYTTFSNVFNTLNAGVNEVNDELLFTVHPNPSSGIFTLSFSDGWKNSDTHFELYDVIGNKVMEEKINAKETTLDLSARAKGIYFVKVLNDKFVLTKKLELQ